MRSQGLTTCGILSISLKLESNREYLVSFLFKVNILNNRITK